MALSIVTVKKFGYSFLVKGVNRNKTSSNFNGVIMALFSKSFGRI